VILKKDVEKNERDVPEDRPDHLMHCIRYLIMKRPHYPKPIYQIPTRPFYGTGARRVILGGK